MSPTSNFDGSIKALEGGVNSNHNAKYAAVHWYQVGTDVTTLAEQQTLLMNHTAISSRFATANKPEIKYLKAHFPDVKYVFSETGSALRGPLDVQGGFGATLWSVDFMLYSMSQGVARVDNTQRPAAKHSFWVPDNSAPYNPGPQVRGPFSAIPFVADFIGKNAGEVVEIDAGSELLTAYALYDQKTGSLSRVAIVNLKIWVEGHSSSSRGSETFSLPVAAHVKTVSVKRLSADAGARALGFDHAGPTQNITWGGEQWSYKVDNGKGHQTASVASEETVQVQNGKANIKVSDTEAVIVFVS